VRYLKVGTQSSNLAISALAMRASGDKPQLFAAITNYSDQPTDVILSLTLDGSLNAADRVSVPAGQTSNLTITDLPETARVVTAQISPTANSTVKDYLAVDDTAFAVFAPAATGRVLLVTEGNLFLQQVLSSLPNVEAFRVQPGELPQDQTFDLVVLDGWLPEKLPDTNLLIINPPATSELFTVSEPFKTTAFLRQADDPILTYVNFKDVAIREAMSVQTPGWARPLIEAEGGPLLLAGTANNRRVAILTFDLHASDLPLKISFPILIANLMQWYAPSQPFDVPDGVRPGEVVVVRPQATTSQYRVTPPDGVALTYPVGEAPLSFAATTELGIYEVDLLAGTTVQNTSYFAVNLFSPVESTIAPADAITVGQTEVSGVAGRDDFGQRELWPWLAAFALAVLVIEWWVFHRGSVLPGQVSAGRGRRIEGRP
jgi:hypothetical protein